MNEWSGNSRRRFLGGAAATGGGLILSAYGARAQSEEEDVSPAEDLMREHGVLKRVLLIYREGIRRIDARQELPPETLASSAKLIQTFIENYHEKLEEEQLFPRFRKAHTLVELVDTLEEQHKRGRILTQRTISLSKAATFKNPQEMAKLREALHLFVRMYEPHEAREDTVLFPAFRKIVTANEYDSLGEEFEDKEHELFGEEGFEKNVELVSGLEKTLGIYDLAKFTPPV